MDKPRPYITAAFMCEKVLQERDGSLSIVRIADRLQYRVEGLPPGVKPAITVNGLVSIKSGMVTGDHTLTIIAERPSGKRVSAYELPVTLKGRDHGTNIILNMNLGIDEDGLWWFDVLFDGELLTRMPLLITPLQEETSQAQAQNAPEETKSSPERKSLGRKS